MTLRPIKKMLSVSKSSNIVRIWLKHLWFYQISRNVRSTPKFLDAPPDYICMLVGSATRPSDGESRRCVPFSSPRVIRPLASVVRNTNNIRRRTPTCYSATGWVPAVNKKFPFGHFLIAVTRVVTDGTPNVQIGRADVNLKKKCMGTYIMFSTVWQVLILQLEKNRLWIFHGTKIFIKP